MNWIVRFLHASRPEDHIDLLIEYVKQSTRNTVQRITHAWQ